MQVQERLAMLCAKTSNMEVSTHGQGGLTPYDISSALSGTPRGPYLLALVKYAGDETALDELIEHIDAMVEQTAEERKWKLRKREVLGKISQLALIESEVVPQKCGQCKGRAWVIYRKLKKPCMACGGTGNHSTSARSKARFLGIDWRTYRNTWSHRLDFIRGTLSQWEIDVSMKLVKELRRC